MYFDLYDNRPETPRIPQAVSIREAVLVSVIVHLLVVIAYLVLPEEWFERDETAVQQLAELQPPDERPLRFIEVLPALDRMTPPERPADASDMDRRSATQERPPNAENPAPFMQGNTPEMIQGAPPAPPADPEPPSPPPSPRPAPPQPETRDASALPPADEGFASLPPEPAPRAVEQTASLRESIGNLQRYFRQENFDNQRGGDTQPSADIQFDSMGVNFGPWLLRFKHQVERNWLVPQILMTHRRPERVVIRFVVQRNGYITNLQVLQSASIPALTTAAVNSLRLSNPTAPLPSEYPREQMEIVVTYHYNERLD